MADNTARNVAQKATAYTTDTLEKVKTTAEKATKVMEQSYLTASKGAVDFNLKLIDMAQENMNAAFDFARQLSHVKSPSEFLELSTSHARKQFEKLTAQSQHLTGLAQKG
jgi:phasin